MDFTTLRPGERQTLALSAFRVRLTGATTGVVLTAVDQAGNDTADIRLSPVEFVLTPRARRVRLLAVPAEGGRFEPGATIGLTMVTEGASSTQEQVLVETSDVGALTEVELGVVEFASDRTVVSRSASGRPRAVPDVEAPAPAPAPAATPATPGRPEPRPVAEASGAPWRQRGLYALRTARERGGPSESPSHSWGLILDGSMSMATIRPAVEEMVGLASGIVTAWTGHQPVSTLVVGAEVVEVPGAIEEPARLCAVALDEMQPWSSALFTRGLRRMTTAVSEPGTVVVVTDGVPEDIEQMVDWLRQHPGLEVVVLTTGRSVHGLPSDVGDLAWWQEELAGVEPLVAQARVRVVSVLVDPQGRAVLDDQRASELASALTARSAAVRP